MPTPLSGTAGTITWGGVNVVWAGEWTASLENNTEEIGPHIGDATIVEVATSQKWTWKISADVISGGDAGQTAIQTAATARTTAALVLTQTLGRVVTFSAANVTKLDIKTSADGTQTIEAEGGNGGGTVALSAG